MSGETELDAIIARVRALGRLPSDVASAAAPKVEEANRATAAAGTSPSGEPWAPRKAGGRALANAASAVKAVAKGSLIQIRLEATSTGSAKVQAIQNAQRPILPRPGEALPGVIVEAIRGAAAGEFRRIVGAR